MNDGWKIHTLQKVVIYLQVYIWKLDNTCHLLLVDDWLRSQIKGFNRPTRHSSHLPIGSWRTWQCQLRRRSRDVNETLGSETETFDFPRCVYTTCWSCRVFQQKQNQSETRPRSRPSHTLPRPRRDRDLHVLGPRRDRDRDVERPRPRRFLRSWHFGLP